MSQPHADTPAWEAVGAAGRGMRAIIFYNNISEQRDFAALHNSLGFEPRHGGFTSDTPQGAGRQGQGGVKSTLALDFPLVSPFHLTVERNAKGN